MAELDETVVVDVEVVVVSAAHEGAGPFAIATRIALEISLPGFDRFLIFRFVGCEALTWIDRDGSSHGGSATSEVVLVGADAIWHVHVFSLSCRGRRPFENHDDDHLWTA